MAEQNVTTKFKVDISDLKKGIAEANKSIKLANAEFKNATAGLDNWSKSADGLSAKIKQQNAVVDAEKKKLDLLKEQLDRLNKSQQDGQKVIKDLTAKYNDAVKTYGETSDEAKKYAKQLTDAEAAQERNAKAADDLNLKIINQDTAVKNAAAQVGKYETALKELENETENAADETDKLDKSVKDVDDASEKTAKGGLNAFGVAIGNLAANLIQNTIKKLGELASAAKDAFLEFDEGRDAVIKATGATGEAADELTKSYANVSKTVAGDLNDIGGALGEVNTRFGFTGKELEDTTAQFIKFADITGTDATNAVKLVSRAMEGAGIDSSDYSAVLDQLAVAAQASGISVDKLTENLTKYGAPMRALGFDTQESVAIFAQWEKAGINTETAFAGMQKAVQNWSKDGKDAKEEFQKTIDAIAAAPDQTKATQLAMEAFGKKAGPELADAIKSGRFEYSDFVDVLKNSEGTVNKTYEETQSGADKARLALQKMRVTMAELVGKFLDKYGPGIEKAIEKISGIIDDLAPKIEKAIDFILDHLPEIEALTIAIGVAFGAWKVASIISAVSTAIAGMSAAEAVAAAKTWLLNSALLANPIGLIVAAIAGLVAAFVVLWKKSDKFRNFWLNLWDAIKKKTKAVIDAIIKVVTAVWTAIKPVVETIKNFLTVAISEIVEMFKAAWGAIKAVWDLVKPYFETIWENIKAVFSVVVEVLGGFFSAAWEVIKVVWDVAVQYFSMIWENIKVVFSAVANTLGAFFKTAWENIKIVWDLVVGYFKMIWDNIKTIFSVVKDVLSGDFSGAWEGIKHIWSNVTGWFGDVWNGIKNIFSNVTDFFKTGFSNAWAAIKGVFSNVGDFFEGVWDTIKGKFTKIGTKIGDAVGGAFKAVINGALELVENTINGGIKLINKAIKIINKIPKVDVDTIDEVSFGRLAKGGVISKPGVFEVGEAGEEAVVPLEKNTGGLKKIAGLLANEMKKSGELIRGNDGKKTVNNYNFTQNNNSPKALSRYDIYRQTKNLINAAKGV